jgi:hypothetical protein
MRTMTESGDKGLGSASKQVGSLADPLITHLSLKDSKLFIWSFLTYYRMTQ